MILEKEIELAESRIKRWAGGKKVVFPDNHEWENQENIKRFIRINQYIKIRLKQAENYVLKYGDSG